MKLVSVKRSTLANKKWTATFYDESSGRTKTTHFGASGMNDYTLTHDDSAKERYWARHQKDLSTHDYTRAGFLSLYLLWNKKNMSESIQDYKRRFGA